MSRILHHVGRNDFKKTRQRRIGEQKERAARKLKELQEVEAERKIIEEAARPYKSDWRLDFLSEAMTTAGLGMINLDATGDVDLVDLGNETPNPLVQPGAENNNGTYTFGPVNLEYGFASTLSFHRRIDLTKVDTVVFDFTAGDITSFDFVVNASFYNLSTSSGSKVVTLKQSDRVKNAVMSWTVHKNAGEPVGVNRISGVALQRRTPINVFVPLDDPEANSFIRGGLGGSEERRQKLKEMLESSNEWMTMLGLEPSKTSPGDIELASHDKPFSKYPPAGGDDKWPGLPQDAIKNYLHPSKDPLLNTPITPFGLPKDFKAQTGDTQVAQMSPRTEAEIDAMLLRGLERGDYGTGSQIQKQIDSLKRNQRNNTPGGIPTA